MGPQGENSDRIADLEQEAKALQRYVATQHRPQAPRTGLVVKNAISAKPPDASEGDSFEATDRPWIIFVDAADADATEEKRSEKPRIRAQTRDGSSIEKEDEKLVVYLYGGRWWIVTSPASSELIYLGDPDSSDAYVQPDEEAGAYDARLYTITSASAGEATESKIWLLVGQCWEDNNNVSPLPRGLVLLANNVGKLETGSGEDADNRPLYYADHWQWLWVKLYLGDDPKLPDKDDERDGEAKVLKDDGTETDVTITVYNHSGVSIPNDTKVFVFYHAESGQWWILNPPAGTIVRAKVLDATITTTGDVNFYDDDAADWSADATEITNRGRPLFSDEVITVGLNRSGEWVPLEVPSHLFDGTADAAIAKGAAGDVTLDQVPNPTINATSRLGAVAADDIVIVAWINSGWQIIAAECPDE